MRRWLIAFILVTAACTRQDQSPEAGSGRHSWTVPHVLRFADLSDPDRLNPYLSTMDITYDVSSLIYSYLIVSNGRGQLIGDLATTVPTVANGGISRDGKTYVYHLHRGVRWHDGHPFTSADVRFSWHVVTNPNNNALHREGFTEIAAMETPDPYTVVVHLKRRYPPFLTQFFAPLQEGGKPILPEHLLARYASINQVAFNAAPVGTGPFKFVKWDRGRSIVLARFDGYFKGRPKLRSVIFQVIPNDNTMLNEMRLHHLDLVVAPPAPLYQQYRAIPSTVVETAPWNAQNLFVINNSKPGLNDAAVRSALAMSIDYGAILKKVAHGVYERAYDVIPPTALGYTKNPPYTYDPAAANALLDRNGYARGTDGVRSKGATRLDYVMDVIAGSASQRALSVQIQQYFGAIGVRLSLKPFTYNEIFTPDGPVYSGRYDFADYSLTLPWDPDNLFYLGCDAWYPKGENVYRYCDPRVDTYERAGLSSDEPAIRAKAYRSAGPIIHATVPYIPIYEIRRLIVRSPDLKNFSANPTSTPWWNAWEWDI